MKHLYFVRHGLSEMNVSGHWSGTTETPLTDEGRQQARLAGQAAHRLAIDYIVSSPLQRAHDTAKIIAQAIGYPVKNIHINELFIERHFGELEGQAWSPDLDLDGLSDIETTDSILERARLALKWLQTLPNDNVLVVSHASFGRALRSLLQPEFPFHNRALRLPNAKIERFL